MAAQKNLTKRKRISSPPLDVDPTTDIPSDLLYSLTSDKRTAFPIFGAGLGYIKKGHISGIPKITFIA